MKTGLKIKYCSSETVSRSSETGIRGPDKVKRLLENLETYTDVVSQPVAAWDLQYLEWHLVRCPSPLWHLARDATLPTLDTYKKPGLPCVCLKSFSRDGLIFKLDELSVSSQPLGHASGDSCSSPGPHSRAVPPTSLSCYCWLTLLVSGAHFYSVAHLPSRFPTFPRPPCLCWPSPYHLLSLTPSHPGTHLFWLGILIPCASPIHSTDLESRYKSRLFQ